MNEWLAGLGGLLQGGAQGIGNVLASRRQQEQDEEERKARQAQEQLARLATMANMLQGPFAPKRSRAGEVRGMDNAMRAVGGLGERPDAESPSEFVTPQGPDDLEYAPERSSTMLEMIERAKIAEAGRRPERPRFSLQDGQRINLDTNVAEPVQGYTPPPPKPERSTTVNWQTVQDREGNYWQVHPQTGQKRPLNMQAPERAAERPPQKYQEAVAGLANFKKALDNYKRLLTLYGPRANPTSPEAKQLEAAHVNLSMVAKNAFELGALSGPDVELLERSVDRPTGWKAQLPKRKDALLAQLNELDRYIANKQSTLGMAYGAGATPQRPATSDNLPFPHP